MAAKVPQTLKYRGSQLNAAPVLEVENFTIGKRAGQRKPEAQWIGDERKATNLDHRLKILILSVLPHDQMNSVINCLTAKSTWDDLILYHEGPFNGKESRVMDLKPCYNTFKEGETLTQTFTRYKALMNELVNDAIKLSNLAINTGFINGLPKKWLSLCQSLRNTNHVKESELASLFRKLKYEENLIDSIYETEKKKSLATATPLSTAFFSTFIVQDFQDSPDDEEDTRSNREYLNDLKEEYKERALLAKSKRFFKKGSQRFSSAKASDNTICHKCEKSLATTTPLSTAFFSTFIVQDFQDSPDDEEDTRRNREYLNDLKEEYQERALLAKSKRLFKKGSQSYSTSSKSSMVKNNRLVASLFRKLKYEENLIDSIYETEKKKSLATATPLSTAFFSTFIVQDFQDNPDDEEDTISNREYLNDLKEEYQERALLAKSKRFFKKGSQRFSSTKASDNTICHKCGRTGHFARDCFSKTSVPSYSSPFQKPQTTIFSPSQ
ncbi:retrovirus-related pol polyprotein from transposon TNT 1-94 [Tanacetum coccineum]